MCPAPHETERVLAAEACGGLVRHRGVFAAHCEESGAYELISRELVDSLAAHIASRADALLAAPPRHAYDDDALEAELVAAEVAAEADARAQRVCRGCAVAPRGQRADDC